ncbi:MAG: DUF697 domain-containing protein [Planctomycetia bacterium]|nr:DUF697 domain-containing protein [Planctomycetia bacterium]
MSLLEQLKNTFAKHESTISEPLEDAPEEQPGEIPVESLEESPERSSLLCRLQKVVEREQTVTVSEEADSGDFGPDLEEVRLRESLLAEEYAEKGMFFQRAATSFSRVVFWFCLLLGGLLAFYMYVQAIALWESVQALPAVLRYPSLGIFAVLLLVVAIAALRLAWMYFSMRANRQVQIQTLQERESLQKTSGKKGANELSNTHFASLFTLVRCYPLDTPSPHLSTSENADPQEWQTFHDRMTKLRKAPDIADSEALPNRREWVQEFQKAQKFLDDHAQMRLEKLSRIVALKTALSPYPLWDMLIVLFWSFQYLTELCRIYNLRVDFYGTARLLLELWITAFCSAKIDSAEEYTQAAAEQAVSGLISNNVAKTIFGSASAKAVSGLANYYLFRRLGRQAIRRIQPLVMETDPT